MKLLTLFFVSVFLAFSLPAAAQDKWQIADKATVRLSPAAFPQLPKNIAAYLRSQNCTIPQSFGDSKPHNVIRGQFERVGQNDWAVLCSRSRVSTILVFWKGSTNSVARICRSKDSSFLQTVDGDGTVGFSRSISVASKRYILEHYRSYGGPKPPKSNHAGINDAFVEKASEVRYFHRKKWLSLQGADLFRSPTRFPSRSDIKGRRVSDRMKLSREIIQPSRSDAFVCTI